MIPKRVKELSDHELLIQRNEPFDYFVGYCIVLLACRPLAALLIVFSSYKIHFALPFLVIFFTVLHLAGYFITYYVYVDYKNKVIRNLMRNGKLFREKKYKELVYIKRSFGGGFSFSEDITIRTSSDIETLVIFFGFFTGQSVKDHLAYFSEKLGVKVYER